MGKLLIRSTAAALILTAAMAGSVPAADYSSWSREQLKSEEAKLTEELTDVQSWLDYGMSAEDYRELEATVQDYTGWTSRVLVLSSVPDRYALEVVSTADDYVRVRPYALDGTPYLSLVSYLGKYSGTVYEPTQEPIMLEVSASGGWRVRVLPLEMLRRIGKGDTATGTGSSVLLIDPRSDTPTSISIQAVMRKSDFISVYSYDSDGTELDRVGPPFGQTELTADFNPDTHLLFVTPGRPDTSWSITLQ